MKNQHTRKMADGKARVAQLTVWRIDLLNGSSFRCVRTGIVFEVQCRLRKKWEVVSTVTTPTLALSKLLHAEFFHKLLVESAEVARVWTHE